MRYQKANFQQQYNNQKNLIYSKKQHKWKNINDSRNAKLFIEKQVN